MADLVEEQYKSSSVDLAPHGNEVQRRFLADSMFNNPTALDGSPCKEKPAPGEILTLNADLSSNGCTFRKFDKQNESNEERDASSVFDKVAEQAIVVESLNVNSAGSGVIIGKNGPKECLALTDLHVINGSPQDDLMTDMVSLATGKDAEIPLWLDTFTVAGKAFPAELRATNPAHDLAVVAMKTGDQTDLICKPAKFAKDKSDLSPGTRLYALTFPLDSKSAYFSVGDWQRSIVLSDLDKEGGADIRPGEDVARTLWMHRLPTRAASSGGPVYNKNAEVVSLVDRVNSEKHMSISTPIDQSEVDDLIQRSR
ncbi:MAG: serine protease [Candidatus Obscuribacterales bacterium]|nr:serine protease [Candidatus Obscuribacterales bacterium]